MVLQTQNNPPQPPVYGNAAAKSERRSRRRANLHAAIRLSKSGSKYPIAGKTSNISSEGFYCFVQEQFEPGERVECTIILPIPKSHAPEDELWIHCQARVVRVEAVSGTSFGIAAQIEEYDVAHVDRADRLSE